MRSDQEVKKQTEEFYEEERKRLARVRARTINGLREAVCQQVFKTGMESLSSLIVDGLIIDILRLLIETEIDLQKTLDLIWTHPENIHLILSGQIE